MLRRSLTAWLVAVPLACSGGSTDDGSEPPGPAMDAADDAAHEDDPPPKRTRTERRRAHLGAWSQCLHHTADRVEQAWDRYVLSVDPETGLPRDKDRTPYIYRVGNQLESCRIGDPPPGIDAELEKLGDTYVDATRGFAELAADLAAYYDGEAYEVDAWAKGKDVARGFAASYETWSAARAAFGKHLDRVRAEVDQAWLDELEAAVDGSASGELRRQVAQLALWGRTAAACVRREASPHTACRTSAEDFDEVVTELDAYYEANRAEALGVFWLDVLRRKAAKLDEALDTATAPPPKKRRPKRAPGEDPQVRANKRAVARAFAAFVLAADRVRFDFP